LAFLAMVSYVMPRLFKRASTRRASACVPHEARSSSRNACRILSRSRSALESASLYARMSRVTATAERDDTDRAAHTTAALGQVVVEPLGQLGVQQLARCAGDGSGIDHKQSRPSALPRIFHLSRGTAAANRRASSYNLASGSNPSFNVYSWDRSQARREAAPRFVAEVPLQVAKRSDAGIDSFGTRTKYTPSYEE